MSQIEWSFCLFADKVVDVGVASVGRNAAYIAKDETHRTRRGNDLCGLALNSVKLRPQHFMPPDDFIETVFHCCDVKIAFQAQCDWDVMCGGVRLQLFQNPESLLGKGERNALGRAVLQSQSLQPYPGFLSL